jgi:hypothetical protein
MKNMKNRIIVIFTLVTGLFLLNSCLKDTADYWPDDVAGKMYITVVKPTLQALALQPVADTVDFEYMINIATDQPPTTDVTVTVAVDASAVTAYNKRAGKSYLNYPSVRIVNPTITIPAGTRTGYIKGKVWGADKLNACDNYMTAVTFKSVSDPNIMIPSNMKSYLLALPISNPYAGDYNTIGYRIRPGNPTEPVSGVETFNTVDCKTVKKNGFGNYTAFDIVIEVTTDVMVVGGVDCLKVIATPVDGNGASVGGMFTTWTGDAAALPPPPANPTDINYYNPVTKQFYLNCYYNSAAGNRIMWEQHTRL